MSDQGTREAIFELWERFGTCIESDSSEGWEMVDAILLRFNATPKDETEWEYALAPSEPFEHMEPSTIRDISAEHLAWQRACGNSIIRRRKAGPWEPVPEEAAHA